MTEAMPFLQKYDITFLRPPAIPQGVFLLYFLYVYIFLLRSFAAAHMAFCFVFVKNRADLVEKSLVKLFKAFCNIFMYG